MSNNKNSNVKTVALTSIGGMLEYYDFVIFSLFAIVLGQTFFPHQESNALAAMYAFTVFSVGYLARPLGGIIFGYIGDKYGRKKSFLLTILLMGVSSFLIALLPSYESIGIVTPILFIILRIIQGASIGGEIPNAVVFVKETMLKKGGLACGFIFCFINAGIFFAEITKQVSTQYFADSLAWRVAFVIGGVAAIVSYIIRKEMYETQTFLSNKNISKTPLITLVKTDKIAMIKTMAAISIIAIIVAYFSMFLPTFFQLNATPDSDFLTLANLFVFSLMCIPSGYLADKIGAYKILIVGSIGFSIFGSLFYLSIINHSPYILQAMLINSIFMGLVVGVAANYSSMLFRPSVRATGLGLMYNLAFAIFNGVFLAIASYGIAQGVMLTPLYLGMTVVVVSIFVLIILNIKYPEYSL